MLTAEQLETRRTGIGGSEIGALLGMDPFAGPLDVWLRKVEGFAPVVNTDMERGTFLEQGVADWYAHRIGLSLINLNDTLRHKSRPLMLATPDRLALIDSAHRLISIKCPRRAGDSWGDHGSQLVPERAVLQLQQEDAVLTSIGFVVAPVFHLAALVEGDLRIYEVERDLELQAWLMNAGEAWWAKHVTTKTPPPLDGSDGANEWLKRRFKHSKPLAPAGIDGELLLLELQAREAEEDKAAKAAEAVRQRLKERIGEAAGLEGSIGRATWKANKHGVRSFRATFTNKEQS